MVATVSAVFVVYAIYMFVVSVRSSKRVKTLGDFFSFKPEHTVPDIIRTFEASNASFMTAFLALYLYSFSLGYATFWIPLGFCLGVVLYAFVFLPRQREYVEAGVRFPELLERRTNAPWMRTVTSAFVVLSFWLFYYAEFQGAVRFFGEIFRDYPRLANAFPLLLVLGLAAYVWGGGFQAVVSTDRVQLWTIYLGTATLIILISVHIANLPAGQDLRRVASLPGFWSFPSFIIQTLIGFAFSQLLYYDNWLRLSLFFGSPQRQLTQTQKDEAFTKLRSLYVQSAVALAIVYSPPIVLGILQVAAGRTDAAPSSLIAFFDTIHSTGLFGRIAVIIVMVQLLSALLSTADTYVISAVATLVEDLFRVSIHSDSTGQRFEASRFVTALFALSVLPAAFTSWDFSFLFTYIFYSANGFVGPLIGLMLRWRLTAATVVTSIAGGFLIPIPLMLSSPLQPYLGYSGIAVSLFSLGAIGFGWFRTRSSEAG